MMGRPTQDMALMMTAGVFEQRSTCDRNHVGAVIARDGRIISTGYNGAPAGMPHCVHPQSTGVRPDGSVIIQRRVSPVPLLPAAPLDRGCKLTIHAEANAIAYAARHGVSVIGATVYVTLSPCYACAQLVIAAGLERVVYDRSYRDPAGIDLLRSAGILVDKV
jgi:dCMP deaminase